MGGTCNDDNYMVAVKLENGDNGSGENRNAGYLGDSPVWKNIIETHTFGSGYWPWQPSSQGNGLVATVGHEFELCITEGPPCRADRCRLNMSSLKHPPVGVVWKLGKEDARAQAIS
ncbi:hypothetical protein TNCV_3508191 [Trichonephila clavipes]|uniref:Uncharacterized protein n=1 Tax=Trichonephila clavipes TaxID=2585209 RepID=A0A8X6RXJ7_TRICX|nr:hypothetical protein TNCV_3508191 [Trichonephila clavipes]